MIIYPRKISDDMQLLLSKEIELNVSDFKKYEWASTANVFREIGLTLIPEIHEGKINSYGVFFTECVLGLENIELIQFDQKQIDLARMLADGEEWLVLYEKDCFYGLIHFKKALSSEIQLIRQFPISGGLVVLRNSAGTVKFFSGGGVTIHDNRRWYINPNVKDAAWKVSQCVDGVNEQVLNQILEFAFHLISPTIRVGSILVWFLRDQASKQQFIDQTDLSPFNLSIMNEDHSKIIFHLLSQIDGATFLSPKGDLIKTGVQLKYSKTSRNLIKEYRGTRHTSSLRFSYDWDDAIVITISEDGPVTVFSSGANIADLQISLSSINQAKLLRDERPDKSEEIKNSSFEINCNHCRKKHMIEEVKLKGSDVKKKLFCPTCKSVLYSSVCFYLEGRPFKRL